MCNTRHISPSELSSDQPARVLIVEGEAPTRMAIVAQLKSIGLSVVECAHGEDAISHAAEHEFSVVVTDAVLGGGMRGTQAAQIIKDCHPLTQIIFVSAHSDDKVFAKAKQCQPVAYLVKPFEPKTLKLAVDLALERRQAEMERQRREEELTRHIALLEVCHDAVIALDNNFRITLFNRAATHLFGWSAEEMKGQSLDRLLPKAARSLHPDHVAQFRSDDVSARRMCGRANVTGLHKDGSKVPLGISIARQLVADESWFLAVVQDLTHTQELKTEARRSQRMDAIGHLATGVVHDLNNLLTIVSSASSLLRLDHGGGEDFDAIDDACRRGAGLTRKLMQVALQQSRRPLFGSSSHDQDRVVVASSLLTGFEGLLRRSLPVEVKSTWSIAPGLAVQGLTRSDLEQIVLNLFVNARDAVQEAGTINVRLLAAKPGPSRTSSPPMHTLEIQDDGVGMDAETVEHATEPFFSTKGDLGSGVGLSTVFTLAKAAGGRLMIESEPGVGTTIRIQLPAADAPAKSDADLETVSVDGSKHGLVWILEASAALSLLDEALLIRAGYRATVFENGDALKQALELGERPDAVISDLRIGATLGADVARAVRQLAPTTGLVFVSGAFAQHGSDCEIAERHCALHRPYTAHELTATVERAIAQVHSAQSSVDLR